MIFQKSFQTTPPIFGHFLIFQCKLARCFQKHLHFGPLVSLQRKSSRNLTLFSGNFMKWIKLCRSIYRWHCLSKLHCHKSLKRGPQGKNVKGLDLLDLSMATPSVTIQLCPQVTLPFFKPIKLYNFFN